MDSHSQFISIGPGVLPARYMGGIQTTLKVHHLHMSTYMWQWCCTYALCTHVTRWEMRCTCVSVREMVHMCSIERRGAHVYTVERRGAHVFWWERRCTPLHKHMCIEHCVASSYREVARYTCLLVRKKVQYRWERESTVLYNVHKWLKRRFTYLLMKHILLVNKGNIQWAWEARSEHVY